jgi:hypothetical protein
MSFKLSNIRWGWVILGTILAVIAYIALQIVINVGYGVVIGFQLRGSPPQEMLNEAFTSLPFLILYVFEVAAGAIIGGRLAGRRGEEAPYLNGLAVGIGTAVVLLVLAVIQNALDLWMAAYTVMAIAGGWLGGWFATRRKR